jgi:hypothetical protein
VVWPLLLLLCTTLSTAHFGPRRHRVRRRSSGAAGWPIRLPLIRIFSCAALISLFTFQPSVLSMESILGHFQADFCLHAPRLGSPAIHLERGERKLAAVTVVCYGFEDTANDTTPHSLLPKRRGREKNYKKNPEDLDAIRCLGTVYRSSV